MGNTADLAVVQKTIIDTLHKEGKFHFEMKVPESGGREERHRNHVA